MGESDELANGSPRTATYSWDDTDRLTRKIASRLVEVPFLPDVIVAVLRGGSIPAVHLAHLLKVRPFGALPLQTTMSDAASAARTTVKLMYEPTLPHLTGKNVLLVDDVTNTGATMREAYRQIQSHAPARIYSVALLWDRLAPDGARIANASCDLWMEETDAWVVFPWNR